MHGLRRKYKTLGNHFGRNRWYSYVMWVKWKRVSVQLEIKSNSAQDRCTFAPNVPREWKSFWAHPIVLLANGGQEEARFDPFGDSIRVCLVELWLWKKAAVGCGKAAVGCEL